MNRQSVLCMGSILSVVTAVPCLGTPTPKCVTDSTNTVCVQFDNLSTQPNQGFDFTVSFNGSHVPTITLITGRNGSGTLQEWRVWCYVNSNNNPAPIDTLQATANYDFHVKFFDSSGGKGASTVGTINLHPSSADKYSRLPGGYVGSITSGLTLQQSSGLVGGDVTDFRLDSVPSGTTLSIPILSVPYGSYSLLVSGDIAGKLIVPVMNASALLEVEGEITSDDSASLDIGTMGEYASVGMPKNEGSISVDEMANGSTLTVQKELLYYGQQLAMVGSATIGTIDSGATATFGPFGTAGSVSVTELGGILNVNSLLLSGQSAGATVSVDTMDDGADLEVSCTCNATVYPPPCSCTGNDSPLSVTVGSAAGAATINDDGPGAAGQLEIDSLSDSVSVNAGHVTGPLTLGNGLPDYCALTASDVGSTGVIDLSSSDIASDAVLTVSGNCSGTIENGGNVSGQAQLSYLGVYSGTATFAGLSGYMSTGRLQPGVLTITGNLTGSLYTHGDVTGTVNVNSDIGADGLIQLASVAGAETDATGNLAGGSINVGGDSQGSITLPGMTGSANIIVSGKQSGTITVFNQMSSGSTIHAVAGLDSGATTSVNSYGDSSSTTSGLIWYGGSTTGPYSTLTFDGAVAINACDGGTFNGTVRVVGCSPTNHRHANICLNGVNSGTISYYSSGCTYGFSTHCTGPCGE